MLSGIESRQLSGKRKIAHASQHGFSSQHVLASVSAVRDSSLEVRGLSLMQSSGIVSPLLFSFLGPELEAV